MLNQAFVHDKSNKLFVHQNMTEIKFTSFGEWLRGKITENNLSNAELGRRVGLSPTYIGNLVRDHSPNSKTGSIRASEGVVASIAKALGVDIDEARLAAGYSPLNTLVFDEETIGLFNKKKNSARQSNAL
jgi:transcriptional regulator with XRE-family HTH domain